MIRIIMEGEFGFSKKGKCFHCGDIHTVEIGILDEQEKYIKLCKKCFEKLKNNINKFQTEDLL